MITQKKKLHCPAQDSAKTSAPAIFPMGRSTSSGLRADIADLDDRCVVAEQAALAAFT